MSTKREIRDFLFDIQESINDIHTFINGMTFEDFSSDRKTMNAVIRSLEIIGKASKKISDEVRHKYPVVPWKEIAGMRDKLIHNYFGVDIEIVWETIKNDLKDLDDAVLDLLNQR